MHQKKHRNVFVIFFIPLLVMLAGCASSSEELPYAVKTYALSIGWQYQLFDINDDKTPELVSSFLGPMEQPRVVITDLDNSSGNTYEQINLPEHESFRLWQSKNGATRLSILSEEDFKFYFSLHTLDGEEIFKQFLAENEDLNENGVHEHAIRFIGDWDINGDGWPEQFFVIQGGYDHLVRSIYCLDPVSQTILWEHKTAGGVNTWQKHFTDMDNDGIPEILVLTSASDNGRVVKGRPDSEAYMKLLELDGSLVWERRLGGKFTSAFVAGIKDIDGDGSKEIIYLRRNHSMDGSRDGIFILDPVTNRFKNHLVTSKKYHQHPQLADIDNDGVDEIIVLRRDSVIEVFNQELELENTFETDQNIYLSACGDLDDDGRLNFIFFSHAERALTIYDNEFNKLAAHEFSPNSLNDSADFIFSTELGMQKKFVLLPSNPGLQLSLQKREKAILQELLPAAIGALIVLVAVFVAIAVFLGRKRRHQELIYQALAEINNCEGQVALDYKVRILFVHRALENLEPALKRGEKLKQNKGGKLAWAILKSREALLSTWDGGASVVTISLLADNGMLRSYRISTRKVISRPGALLATISCIEDVDKEKRQSQAMENANIGQEIIHRIKTLDSVVRNNVHYLQSHLPLDASREAEESLEEISIITEKVRTLSSEFLRLTRLENQQMEKIDLNELLRRSASLIHDSFTSDIAVEYDFDEFDHWIFGNEAQLETMFENLLKNAFEATGTDGRVIISTSLRRKLKDEEGDVERHIYVSITDTGPGIAPDLMQKILSTGYSTKRYGSGVGLLIARRIASLHGGELALETTQDVGTTVTVRLPLL